MIQAQSFTCQNRQERFISLILQSRDLDPSCQECFIRPDDDTVRPTFCALPASPMTSSPVPLFHFVPDKWQNTGTVICGCIITCSYVLNVFNWLQTCLQIVSYVCSQLPGWPMALVRRSRFQSVNPFSSGFRFVLPPLTPSSSSSLSSSTLFPNTAAFSKYAGMQRVARPRCVIRDENAVPEDIKYKF